ncbi:unnamed protein product [Rotaria magnacalcarata]|uniref:Helix-turn-helix domain-containing protein n=4 Tax=Rotaria magnacalcarata TaxID=392030 RepID=A0A815YF44_9BILA|nr:unnamed protein product [Rotaria magnacalcarata]
MRQLTKEYRTKAMSVYVQSVSREREILENEIKHIIGGFQKKKMMNNIMLKVVMQHFQITMNHAGTVSRERNQHRRTNCPDSSTVVGRGFLAPTVINDTHAKLTEDEYQLLKLGPRFIYNDPKAASRRRPTELATFKRKIEARLFEKKVSPGRPVEDFIAELDIILRNLHNTPININTHRQHRQQQQIISYDNLLITIQSSQSQIDNTLVMNQQKKKNYGRLVKRLKHKIRSANLVLQKTDKSKVFHLGKREHYHKKSNEYMKKTEAYECLGGNDPLGRLIEFTNKYLLNLRLAKWITQKQYERLCVKPDEVKLPHLYYLPKTHKAGTPLRPIVSGLKHPTIKISKYLDELLRSLFDKIALKTTVTSGFEGIKQLHEWSTHNLHEDTLLCAIDVVDLYTMIPQTEGVLAIKKMLDYLKIKQIDGLKIETIIRLSRFVLKNNYFSYEGQYYHQIRGGAMGSPLTLTIANCYMFFFERNTVKQITNAGGIYSTRHLYKQIDLWNNIDSNIKLIAQVDHSSNFLDLYAENMNGHLFTKVYHKPSYEPYYLPFNSIHPLHMKKNIPFAMFLRAIRYCSTFKAFLDEREDLRMAPLLNKYPGNFIDNQFNRVLKKCNITQSLTSNNYNTIRKNIIYNIIKEEKIPTDHYRTMFIHFTYCLNIRTLPTKFHTLCNKYFSESPINEIIPIIGTLNVQNLQKQLVKNK